MSYEETLQYLFDKLPMFSRVGAAAYKPDLNNTIALCNHLNNPQNEFKSIHIGGTNGKGSVSHILASVFQTARYKTGLYTSPHLFNFEERIKINGKEVEKEWIIEFVEKLKPLIEQIKPSFFEVTVAMAFSYFAINKVDIAIIEVGLGGLLDSTNIIKPELSLITNISFDHTQLLGNTLQEIAIQKAGIIKTNIPVVIGETDALTATFFKEVAFQHQSEILFADQEYSLIDFNYHKSYLDVNLISLHTKQSTHLEIGLTGRYQIKNIKSVLTALDMLRKNEWRISETDIFNGVKSVKHNTGIKGRFDQLLEQPRLFVDVAHNEAGIKEVLAQVTQMKFNSLHFILGFVKDKEIDKVLTLFPQRASYYFTQANTPRALSCMTLYEKGTLVGLKGSHHSTVKEAISKALTLAHQDDLILVTGSFFILEDVYTFIQSGSHFKRL